MVPRVITPPAAEQITLAQARLQLSLSDNGDSPPSHPLDPLIAQKIASAREYCEDYLALALAPQTVELALDSFGAGCPSWNPTANMFGVNISSRAIELQMAPITSIVSVKYVDADGTEQTLSDALYVLDDYQMPGWLLPAAGTSWPSTKAVVNAVKIRYACGYSIKGDSPETRPLPMKFYEAMMVLMTDMVDRRGEPSDAAMKAAESLMELGTVRLGV